MSKETKMGRPALPEKEKRGTFISTRLSSDEYRDIQRAIKASKKAKTEWVRESLLAAARG